MFYIKVCDAQGKEYWINSKGDAGPQEDRAAFSCRETAEEFAADWEDGGGIAEVLPA